MILIIRKITYSLRLYQEKL